MSTAETFVPYMPEGTATPESVATTIAGAAQLLGAFGENWTTGQLTMFRGVGQPFAFCVVGALERAAPDYASYAAARDAVKAAAGSNHLDRWNNGATWQEVSQALTTASAQQGA